MSSNKKKRELISGQKERKRQRKRAADQLAEERSIRQKAAAKRLAPIDRSKITSRSCMPTSPIPTLAGRYYLNWRFKCIDCGKSEIWTSRQQKWWHEEAGGAWEQIAVRCRDCRQKEKARKELARRVHLEGLERKRKEQGRKD
ncbi:zinc-ribbon domain containing protein [Luteolibacter marinus]|uniref:zinc-ribbon domain containing protein n=1 Tax=Luteolibacter marinus TaxID=2776705 RepID=UPI001865FA7E|nr:zinc-ribbon domain containing protein [Luteolibacter marinus]